MAIRPQNEISAAPGKNIAGCVVGQGLGCLGAYLLFQIGAVVLPLILTPIFGKIEGINSLLSMAMTGCTCLGSAGLAFAVSLLVARKFPPLVRRPRPENKAG